MQETNFDTTKHELTTWIENLPLANPIKALEMLHDKLSVLSANKFSGLEWFELLSLIQPTFYILDDASQARFTSRVAISVAEQNRMTNAFIALASRYANAYIVILSLSNADAKLPDASSLTARSIHQALYYLARALVVSLQLYMPAPNGLWLQLHQLYAYAEKLSLTNTPLKHFPNQADTIANAYKVAILLATANPYQLRAQDIQKLYDTLIHWSSYAKLIQEALENAIVVFELDKDLPPVYQVVRKNAISSPYTRGLETKALIDHINSLIKQRDNTMLTQESVLSNALLPNIAKAWSTFSERLIPREERDSVIEICLGLSAAHFYISGEKVFMPPQAHAKTTPAEDTTSAAVKVKYPIHMWKTVNTGEDTTSAALTIRYPIHMWNVVNVSPVGYCLQTTEADTARVESGDLIGLKQLYQQQTYWRVGMIKWVKKIQPPYYHVGIFILGPRAIPVAIETNNNSAQNQHRALILPDIIGAEKGSTIILPPLSLSANQELQVINNDERIKIKLTEPLNLNDKFFHFKYMVLSESEDSA
jgi:hypothetical protein